MADDPVMPGNSEQIGPIGDTSNGPTVEVITTDELEVRQADGELDEAGTINADNAGIVSGQPPPKKPKSKKKSGTRRPGSKRGLVRCCTRP